MSSPAASGFLLQGFHGSSVSPPAPVPCPGFWPAAVSPPRGPRHGATEGLLAPHCSRGFSGIPLTQEGKCLKLPLHLLRDAWPIVTTNADPLEDTAGRVMSQVHLEAKDESEALTCFLLLRLTLKALLSLLSAVSPTVTTHTCTLCSPFYPFPRSSAHTVVHAPHPTHSAWKAVRGGRARSYYCCGCDSRLFQKPSLTIGTTSWVEAAPNPTYCVPGS